MLIATWILSAYKTRLWERCWHAASLARWAAEPNHGARANPPVLVEQQKSMHLPALFTFHKPRFPVFHLFAVDLIRIRISCRATPASLPVGLFAGEWPACVCVCMCVCLCNPQTSINSTEGLSCSWLAVALFPKVVAEGNLFQCNDSGGFMFCSHSLRWNAHFIKVMKGRCRVHTPHECKVAAASLKSLGRYLNAKLWRTCWSRAWQIIQFQSVNLRFSNTKK